MNPKGFYPHARDFWVERINQVGGDGRNSELSGQAGQRLAGLPGLGVVFAVDLAQPLQARPQEPLGLPVGADRRQSGTE